MELLSPAGSYESLVAAVQSGADAVYIGGLKFGARQSAVNFDIEQMRKWTDYCHLYGVKVYVTVNTLVKDAEMSELAEYIKDLNSICVDGVLVQDFGVLSVIRNVAPKLPVHASTQMTATSLSDVQFLESQGFSRVVLSRELSYEQIKEIRNKTNCEIEVFVHGALCMSYSGQCLMSSILGGRSGNRGRCAQPCRLPYTLESKDDKTNGFMLSPKDLCLARQISKLKAAGVASLKIEGRLKRAGYVSTVVGIYRKCIDQNMQPTKVEIKQLEDAFGRGFTTGFFGGDTGKNMMSFDNSSNMSDNIFTDEALKRCRIDADFRKVNVSISAEAKIGSPLIVTMSDDAGNTVVSKSDAVCEVALKAPTGEERLKESLLKLGGTPYICEDIRVYIDDVAVIPVSSINAVRRHACEAMNNRRIKREPGGAGTFIPKKPVLKNSAPEIVCEVSNSQQYEAASSLGIKNIIAPVGIGDSLTIKKSPVVSMNGTISPERIFVSNLGQIFNCQKSEIIGSHRLNITNSYSADFYYQFMKRSLLSSELSLKEISHITGSTELDCGIIGYGRLDLMYCANCPIKASGRCQNGKNVYHLRDRKGEKFPVVCSDNCSVRIINSKPVYMADKWKDIEKAGVGFVVLAFTTEGKTECENIIQAYLNAAKGIEAYSMKENSFTRGHFYRGVL